MTRKLRLTNLVRLYLTPRTANSLFYCARTEAEFPCLRELHIHGKKEDMMFDWRIDTVMWEIYFPQLTYLCLTHLYAPYDIYWQSMNGCVFGYDDPEDVRRQVLGTSPHFRKFYTICT